MPNLITDMNASKYEFTVHDGDLKAGNGPSAKPPSVNCDDSLYQTALGANGLNDVHWVKVLVDPSSRDVFAFQPQIVPANRVAVPAPTS